MTQKQHDKINENAERVIAEYLQKHPDFFARHLRVLAALQVPHPCKPAVSLLERQVDLFREQNDLLRKKLRDLVKVARDNDCLSKRMQQLNLVLIEARSLDEMLHGVQSVLRDEFNADFTTLRLPTLGVLETASFSDKDKLSPAALSLFTSLFDAGRPICGRLTDQQLQYLFDDAAEQVASAALIPLKGMTWKGLIAIGSRDSQRFHPGIGTLFLSRIGELISHALQPHLQTPVSATS